MENIIKGLEILNTYNGNLSCRVDKLIIEDFEYKIFLKDDISKLESLGWELLTKRDTKEIIRVSYDTSKM